MTKARLMINVAVVALVLIALVGIALLYAPFYGVLKDFSGIFVAVAAAYLAYCFQKRQSFLATLRDLWTKCIEAKAELIEYTHLPNPTQQDFGKAHRALSTAIDMMRAVYRNVNETDRDIGLYPFEPLHDMRKALERLGFTNVTLASQSAERANVVNAWNAFRYHFLQEFSAPAPHRPITAYGARDPRRAPSQSAASAGSSAS